MCGFRVSCKTAGNAGGDHGAAQLDGPAGGVPLDQLGGGGAGSVLTMATTIVIALPAAPTWKKTFGFHPMTAFADHGAGRNGEPLTMVLRNGSAGSNTAADHIEASRLALAQLPRRLRRKVLIRADSGGGTHGFLEWLTANSRRLYYSVGMTITEDMQDAVLQAPAGSWRPAYDGDGQVRDGPGSRTSPGCSTCRPGRPGCGSSSARSGRIPGRSCGSPTSTRTGSPP